MIRILIAAAISMVVSLFLSRTLVFWLTRLKIGQPIREDGPESHLLTKQGTPTMGGFLILIGISVGTLLWADLSNQYVWIVLFVTVGYGLIGFLDDFTKVTKGHAGGLSGKSRLAAEFVIAVVAVVWVARYAPIAAEQSALQREAQNLLPVLIPEGFETSLTIPNIRYVVDSGKHKQREYGAAGASSSASSSSSLSEDDAAAAAGGGGGGASSSTSS